MYLLEIFKGLRATALGKISMILKKKSQYPQGLRLCIRNFPNTEKINATSYSVHSYKRLNYFKCNLCGKMTIYNINNACTDAKCQGKLIPVVDVDSITDNNYYRKEYMNRAIEKIDCREHTAQMNSDEAKAIQNDFKNKKLNIISCSTTFEMGIDLGGLNTVYMRNVPPTPANYAQRAGRAGRRADTSAYILTFCSLSSHDFTYFDEPPAMIKGLVDPPYFLIDNDKIILRHITAAVLSVYFRKNPTEFASVDNFINLDVIGHLLSYIQSKPQELGNYIDHYILESQDLINKYGNFKWTNYLCRPENPLYKMKTGLEEEMQLLKEAYEYEKATENHDAAKKAQEALRVFKEDSSLVTSLTKYNVIPGYGFPIDTVNLFIWDQQSEDMDSHYNLSRNLPIAISEYAPDSEVIVDGKKYTSRYLMIPKKANALPTTQYVECDNCHQKNLAPQSVMGHFKQGDTCVYCGTPLVLNNGKLKSFVTPIYGFVADKRNKATRRIKPAKTYASDVFYVGKGIQNGDSISINNVVTLTEFKDEQLLVMNENRFFTCDLCGYSVLEKAEDKKNRVPHIIANHETFRGDPCSNNKLNPVSLGHTYSTDVIKIEFSNILEMQDEETALSVLYALLSGISIAYTIEREDINGIIFRKNITKPYSLILFDAVPGGAGHVKRLKESGSVEKIIRAALKKVENCECGLETSCYGCLRTYNNQKIHKHLIRGKAVDALRKILDALLDTKIKFSIVGVPHTEFTDAYSIQDFINDELLDEAENNIFTDLFAEIKLKGAEFPDGYWYTLKSSDGRKTIKPSFVWEQKKILLFEPTRENEYHFMINNQNYYHCYLMNNSFDVLSFVDDLLKQ